MARKKQIRLSRTSYTISRHTVLVSVLVVLFLLLSIPFTLILFRSSRQLSSPYHKENLTIPPHAKYIPNQMVVKYKSGFSPTELKDALDHENKIITVLTIVSGGKSPQDEFTRVTNALNHIGVTSEKQLFSGKGETLKDYYLLQFKENTDLHDAQKFLNAQDFIEFAQPNYLSTPQAVPNDPEYSKQWDMKKIGMEQVWDSLQGSLSVTVAVVDTGVAYNHPDLAGNVVLGKDYAYGTNDPNDVRGHGTHVAGVIGAIGNNAQGIAGINWHVKILAEKVCGNSDDPNNPESQCSDTNIAQAITDAADAGARVVNLSLTVPVPCSQGPLYQDSINYAFSKNVMVVSAAGNGYPEGVAQDAGQFTPASCQNTMTVGATGPQDERAFYSNYGSGVDIAAPGGDPIAGNPPICDQTRCIDSTWPSGYNIEAGTSMAAPHVSGALALLASVYPSLSATQVMSCVLQGSDPISTDLPVGGRRLNVPKALAACKNVTPAGSGSNQNQSGNTSTQQGFGLTPIQTPVNRTIQGTVYIDENGNRQQDTGELGYQGAQIILSGAASGSQYTDKNGEFSFQNLPSGSYTLTIKLNGQTILTQGPFPLENSLIITVGLPSDSLGTRGSVAPVIATATPIQNSTNSSRPVTPTPTFGYAPPTPTPTLTPTPAVLYECRDVPTTQTQNGHTIQIMTLQCTALQ